MKTISDLFAYLSSIKGSSLGAMIEGSLKEVEPIGKTAFSKVENIPFQDFCLDSRHVKKNDVFVLLKSQTNDLKKSQSYLEQVADTAVFVLSEIDPSQLSLPSQLSVCYLADIRYFLGGLIQLNFCYQYFHQSPIYNQNLSSFNYPNLNYPNVVAVTGTNGKTTISQLVAQLAQSVGKISAVMGTAGNGRLGALQQATHTTGDVLAVQAFLYEMAKQQVDVLSLEASSHGLDQYRLQGMPIKVAIFSNLSRDHLDYHQTMDLYAKAKSRLFDKRCFPNLTHCVINLDDDFAPVMIKQAHCHQKDLTVWTYSLCADTKSDFVVRDICPSLTGVDFRLDTPQGEFRLHSPLLGLFNVANLVASLAGVMALGFNMAQLQLAVASLQGASGRMQRIASKTGCFIVDYAHTPDALVQVLSSLKPHCQGKLWAVFGCGGDRDKGKRPLMAQAGLEYADRVVLTADNPRSEDPMAILADMQEGMSCEQHYHTHIEVNRRQAIAYAVANAGDDDIVVIAGKGHETYQEIQGVRYDFDDRVVLADCLQAVGRLG